MRRLGRALPVDLVEPEKKSKGVVSQVVTDEQNTPSVKEEEVKQRREKLHEALNPELDAWNPRRRAAEWLAGRIP